jgi:hypothetical protein
MENLSHDEQVTRARLNLEHHLQHNEKTVHVQSRINSFLSRSNKNKHLSSLDFLSFFKDDEMEMVSSGRKSRLDTEGVVSEIGGRDLILIRNVEIACQQHTSRLNKHTSSKSLMESKLVHAIIVALGANTLSLFTQVICCKSVDTH